MKLNMYHYFDKDIGPFKNLSKLSKEEAEEVSQQIRLDGKMFASKRSEDYLNIRGELESIAREQFVSKGGRPYNTFPHYMTLGACDWLQCWYKNPRIIAIPWEEFSEDSISFTYGDLFPTMRYQDDKPYRRQVYIKEEIKELIGRYGFPQDWNINGDKGPERYIEVQVWDEVVIKQFLND